MKHFTDKVRNFAENIPEDFESKFREWWNLVWENHIEPCTDGFDLSEEVEIFLKNPDDCLLEERKWKKELDEEMQKCMEEDIKSGAWKPDEEVKK